MPNNKYNPKEEVFVPLPNGLNYVFQTNVDAVARTALGHTALPTPVPALSFSGGNSPKPRKARILTADGWNSSFMAETPALIATLKTGGWQIQRPSKTQGIITGSAARAVTVYVTVRGIKYAWNMASETRAALTDATLTALGINVATTADIPTLVWGASLPRPAKVEFKRTTAPLGGTSDTLSTFVGQAQEDNLPAGFKIKKPRLMFPGDPFTAP